MEGLGRGRLNTYCYTVTTRMSPALRWAAKRAILMFHKLRGTKSQDSVHKPQLLKRKESRSGFDPKPLSLTSITPYRLAILAHKGVDRPGSRSKTQNHPTTYLRSTF